MVVKIGILREKVPLFIGKLQMLHTCEKVVKSCESEKVKMETCLLRVDELTCEWWCNPPLISCTAEKGIFVNHWWSPFILEVLKSQFVYTRICVFCLVSWFFDLNVHNNNKNSKKYLCGLLVLI